MARCTVVLAACLCLLAVGAHGHSPGKRNAASAVPDGFVRLRDLAPAILQDIRYASPRNVLGRPLKGYEAPVCLLRRPAAEALARVQAALKPHGLGLLVFDCYRPSAAVGDLVAYVERRSGRMFSPYHPNVSRTDLIAKGFVGRRSLHATGRAVDLTLVVLDPNSKTAGQVVAGPCPIQDHPFALPMGTAFDCFDAASGTNAAVSAEASSNRNMLIETMTAQGFQPYAGEWWHFTFPASNAAESQPQSFPVR